MARPDCWLTTTDIANDLGVSAETVRRMIRAKKIAAIALVGSRRTTYRISRRSFEAYRGRFVKDTSVDDWE